MWVTLDDHELEEIKDKDRLRVITSTIIQVPENLAAGEIIYSQTQQAPGAASLQSTPKATGPEKHIPQNTSHDCSMISDLSGADSSLEMSGVAELKK